MGSAMHNATGAPYAGSAVSPRASILAGVITVTASLAHAASDRIQLLLLSPADVPTPRDAPLASWVSLPQTEHGPVAGAVLLNTASVCILNTAS
eukprot:2710135-Rhodomonas_salina.3